MERFFKKCFAKSLANNKVILIFEYTIDLTTKHYCFRITTGVDNRLREVALEEKEPTEQNSYLRTDWQELSEMGPQFENFGNSVDIPIDKTYWINKHNMYSSVEVERLTGWIDSQKSSSDFVMDDCPVVSPSQLNPMQRLAFEIVKSHSIEKKQLLMIMIGAAGSGKTFTIHAIATYLNGSLKRAAPTAKAAFLINGDTIHELFNIRTNEGREIKDLEGENLRKLQDSFNGIYFIIIDEYSMLSQTMLTRIDKRMRQITQKLDVYFGGLSLILTGDPAQLPAVLAPCLYDTKSTVPINMEGLNLFKQFKSVIQLTQIMRQEENGDLDQKKFLELLPRFRTGECTLSDYYHLKKRFLAPYNQDEFKDTTRIFQLNESCDEYNIQRLKSLNNPITKLSAKNIPDRGRNYGSELFRGLKNSIYVCIGSKVI